MRTGALSGSGRSATKKIGARRWCLLITLMCGYGCSSGLDGPAPKIAAKAGKLAVEPGILCADQRETDVTLHGKGFSPVPIDVPDHPRIAIPDVSLIRKRTLDGKTESEETVVYSGDPTRTTNLELLSWRSQTEMHLTVNQTLTRGTASGALEAGMYDVRVKNPNEKHDQLLGALAVVKKPELTAISPSIVCLEQDAREVGLEGTTLLDIDGHRPTVSVKGVDTPFPIGALDRCKKVAHEHLKASFCTHATLSLPKESLAVGVHRITLTNPETAACHSEEPVDLRVVPAPTISGVNPPVACNLDGVQQIVIQGSGFLRIDAKPPTVMLAGKAAPVKDLSGCKSLATTGHEVESCTGVVLDVEVMAFPVGDVAVNVTNPEPAGCAASGSAVFRVAGPPTITAVAPTEICNGIASQVTITGTGFDPAAQVLINSTSASKVEVVSDMEIIATVDAGLAPGSYDLTVTNVGSCTDKSAGVLSVDSSPIVFFVDPPVTYSGMPVEVTIFTSGLSSKAAKVELLHEDGTTKVAITSFDSPTKPNKILAQVPEGLKAGKWDVYVTDAGGCPGVLAKGLTVTDTLKDTLVTAIKPSYVSPNAATAVTITGAGFVPVPRVYLTPSAGSGAAQALSAVETAPGGDALTAVVPAGLTPATYDLIVVNPDGNVDVLDQGVTVTADEPPVVASVTPASLPSNATGKNVTIFGTGFKADLTVVLDCLTTSGARVTVPTTAATPTGGGTSVVVTLTMSNGTPSAPDAGSVCLVRLTNADGAFFEYSAFSVTNSSLNLSPWTDSTELTTARRALSLVAGRPTNTSRYLYAIGGDAGTANAPTTRGSSVFKSIDSTNVDVFGGLDAWTAQRNELPSQRTGAGAVTIGRFVYLLGGHDGTSAVATLLRAQILDPLAAPTLTDLDAALGDGSQGLTGGLYYYRVAAVFPGSDASNPGGESLSGDLLPVQLPDRKEKIVLTLSWSEVTGAHGYRLYRSPSPDASAGSLELVGEVTCGAGANDLCDCGADATQCALADAGTATTPGQTPLPAGSLGIWHAVDGARCTSGDCLLGKAREGLSVTAVQNPSTPGTWYLYGFGGRDQTGAHLDSYEIATVSVAPNGSQTVGDFVGGGDTLSTPRADFAVWVMSKNNSNVIASSVTPSDVWVYVGGGRTTGDATSQTLEAGKLGANGDLGTFASTDSLKGALVGFAAGASNDQLYTFGGVSGSADGTSASLCDGSGSCAPLPDLRSGAFNALGAATTQRMFMGATQESAFFFLAGGHDGTQTLVTSEQTVQ